MSEERDSYWIVEWRYPASLGKAASSWMPCDMPPCRYEEAARNYPQRNYYEYRISEFQRRASDPKGGK